MGRGAGEDTGVEETVGQGRGEESAEAVGRGAGARATPKQAPERHWASELGAQPQDGDLQKVIW